MIRPKCPRCGNLLVIPAGPENSRVLLVGEFPGVEEQRRGVPFVGKVGDILKTEMIRAGMDLYSCRATNLWQHAKNDCDLEWHKNQMIREFKRRKFVLLMGSDLSKMFFQRGVMELCGMEMKSELFPGVKIFVVPIPPYIGPVGEFRLAMERFVRAVND